MRVRLPVPFVLVLACALLAPVAHARRHPAQPRPQIANGVYTSDFPSVGVLLTGSAVNNAQLTCSGTLIGCHTFLTAAHCVCDSNGPACQPGQPFQPNAGKFFVFLQHAGFFAVSNIAVRSDFAFPAGDVAVLTLAAPVTGVRPSPIETSAVPAAGTAATLVGYGREGSGLYEYGLKRRGDVALSPCTHGVSDATSVCWTYTNPLGAPGTDSDTCNGDSGGPLFVDRGCGPVVAGITSGGSSSECIPTDDSYDANVFHYHDYIQATGGADVGAPSCGAMPQAGEAGTVVSGADGALDASTTDATFVVPVAAGAAALRVGLNSTSNGDFDLYVRFGAPPVGSTFDCKDDRTSPFGFCELSSPAAGDWYVTVHRYAGSGAFQMTATTVMPGLPGPGADGTVCNDGQTCTTGDVCSAGHCAGTPAVDGASCDDGRSCTGADACVAGVCAGTAAPLAGCHQPIFPGKSQLLIQDSPVDSRDTLRWSWKRGSTAVGELGDPTASTRYEVCLFDDVGGTPQLIYDQTVAPGAAWTTRSTGVTYKDHSGTNGGLLDLRVRPGTDAASLKLKARGSNLLTPSLPLYQNPRVTMQVLNGSACWEARFSTNAKNQGDQFKASSD